jgi:hypothetical protein
MDFRIRGNDKKSRMTEVREVKVNGINSSAIWVFDQQCNALAAANASAGNAIAQT